MSEKMDPAVKVLYLQLDAMTGRRRAVQELADKMDADIKRIQAMIKEAEAKRA